MDERPLILIVDDEPVNRLLLKKILEEKYELIFAADGYEALLQADQEPDLILLDVMMPEMSGYEVCSMLRENPKTKDIPVIFVTALDGIKNETEGFDSGGQDYVTKPIKEPIVIRRVEMQLLLHRKQQQLETMVRERTSELEEKNAELKRSQRSTILMLGEAGHFNDTDTGVHIWRMAKYAEAIARSLGWPEGMCELIELAAPMHDTGKIGVLDSILQKPGKLSPEEWEIIKNHPRIGYNILIKGEGTLFVMASEISLSHHERWNGSGYPEGLSGDSIPESSRIASLADVFDALTMKRPYKEPWTVERAVETINEDSGSHFDPRVINAFNRILPKIVEIKGQFQDENES